MDSVLKFQQQLLEQARFAYYETPIGATTAEAFLAVPRHAFISRYRMIGTKDWQEVTPENLHRHLRRLYSDVPLCLFGDDDDDILSTISQPSFVLRSLDLLQLHPGQQVFELGTGSGWNAALMAHMVRPEGHVYSVELIANLASRAKKALNAMGIGNVTVVVADGGDGYTSGAPYDRATFTAGTFDRLFGLLVRCGFGLRHNYLLQVRGRTSGRLYSTPVNVLEVGTRRFLVAPRGETQWVRNARVSGQVRLVKGKTSANFRLRELADEEKPEILKTYLDRFRTTVQRYFPVPAGSPLESFSNLAPMYPVFELRSVATKTVSGPLP